MVSKTNPLASIPAPSEKRIAIRVTPEAERALRAGHPWLFAAAIRRQSHEGHSGDLAVIFDRKDRFLAIGLYDPLSPIRVRILQHHRPAPINQAWFAARLLAAQQRRHFLQSSSTTGYRLVHGENDGLPGLVIDRYANSYVLKLYTSAWVRHLSSVLPAFLAEIGGQRLILRLSRQVQTETGALFGLHDGATLYGPPPQGSLRFVENGLQFEADAIHGQKTGFFLDQRENRARVERMASGASVLNVFSYTGGFSLYAARGGATTVVSLDMSLPALLVAKRHFEINLDIPAVAAARHETLQGDAFALLERVADQGRLYDLVVLDPPAFARRQDEVAKALAGYGRLARLGLRVLRRGGILVAASCSSRVSANDFFHALHKAAAVENRPLQEMERTGHPLDHPVDFKEGAYLKCLFARS
jgi:23S rRNA (cytosine1962-C5)-methyltransferase